MGDLMTLVGQFGEVVSKWQSGGALVGGLALGFAMGFLSTVTKQPWSEVLTAAVTSAALLGLGAVGLDQWLSNTFSPRTRDGASILTGLEHVLHGRDAEADTRTDTLKRELESAKIETDPKKRRKALAAWGRRHLGVRP